MHLNLNFKNQVITVVLFNNPTVRKWFEHFSKINNDKKYYNLVKTQLHFHDQLPTNDSWQKILNTVDRLSDFGYKFPVILPTSFDRQQSTLNFLHRFFTYNVLWYHDQAMDKTIKNPYDANFVCPDDLDFQSWLDIIDVINVSVHDLENFAEPHQNKKLIVEHYPLSSLMMYPLRTTHTDLSTWLQFDDQDVELNYNYLDFDYPVVRLNESILGKCLLQSFYENDDPTAKDCTGRLGSYGGFSIDLNNNRKRLYQSNEFLQWIAERKIEESALPLEFSIGYVKDLDQELTSWLSNNWKTFIDVEFVNN